MANGDNGYGDFSDDNPRRVQTESERTDQGRVAVTDIGQTENPETAGKGSNDLSQPTEGQPRSGGPNPLTEGGGSSKRIKGED